MFQTVMRARPHPEIKAPLATPHLCWERGADPVLGQALREAGPWFSGAGLGLLGLWWTRDVEKKKRRALAVYK
jgi:hypothetical protein